MNARAARWVIRLYPSAWRVRYSQEFQMFLAAHPDSVSAWLDVIACALYERIIRFGENTMSKLQHSIVLLMYAYLAAVTAGVNLVGSVDDTALAGAIRTNPALSACWNLVAAASMVAVAAIVALGLPVVWWMIRFARTAKRRDILVRLAFPPLALAVLLSWITAVVMKTGWLPLFWDVAGDFAVPANWPSPANRWALSSVTLMLVAAGLVGSAISLKQAVQRTILPELSVRHIRLTKISTLVLAGSIVVMTLGAAAWGLAANLYVPAEFHSSDGGFLGSANHISWMGSLVLFAASTVTALCGARWAMRIEPDFEQA